MRKVLRRTIVLCMACMICMSGLCMAKFIKDDDGNWVEFYREDEKPWNIYYVDTNAIKVCEYEGKKYLDVSIRRKENTVENYVYYIHQTEVTNAKFHRLLDLENRKKHNIEWQNKYAKQKRGTADISEIKNGKSFTPWDEKLVTWVEQNYPAVIDEIRTFNHSGQSATNVTDAPGAPRGGSLQDIVGDIEYEVLDSGAVKFSPRCMGTDGYSPLFEPFYFIFTKPEKYSAWPGAYLVGWVDSYFDEYFDEPTIQAGYVSHGSASAQEDAFDYDPKTQTFTFYDWNEVPNASRVSYRMQVINKNTVCITYRQFYSSDIIKNRYHRYMPYDKLPIKSKRITIDGSFVMVEDNDVRESTNYDENQCVWCGDRFPYFWEGGILTPLVDMARAFLAVNGKVGTVPEGYNLKTVDP